MKESSPGTPVWSHDGGICTGEAYKQVVKLTFFHGASLKDPAQLFNSSLGGNTRRAIDIREDDAIDEAALKELIRAAVALNAAELYKCVWAACEPPPVRSAKSLAQVIGNRAARCGSFVHCRSGDPDRRAARSADAVHDHHAVRCDERHRVRHAVHPA